MDKEKQEQLMEANKKAHEVYMKAAEAHDALMIEVRDDPSYPTTEECRKRAAQLVEIFEEAATMFKDIRAFPPFFHAATNAYHWYMFLGALTPAKMWLERITLVAMDACYVIGRAEVMSRAQTVQRMEEMVNRMAKKKVDGKAQKLEVVSGGNGEEEEGDE